MRITPLDVRKQEFRKGMRGLDPEEVYAFLSTVADEYESILNDNKALRERLLELDDKVQEYRSMEKTLRDTLLTAERVNVEAKDNARREANIIIKEAQIEAEKALRDIKTEAMTLRQQVQQLRGQRDSYLARMKLVAESHLSTITSAVADFEREDELLDVDVNEEGLADEPVDREVTAPPHPTNLFEDTPPARQPADAPTPGPPPESRASDAPTPQPPSPRTPPTAPAQPSHEPRSAAPNAPGISAGSVDPISVIIDRMKKGQMETLASGSGVAGIADPATDDEPSESSQRKEPAAPVGTAVAPDRNDAADDGAPVGARPEDVEVTSEFNLDEIRRELAEEKGKS